MELFFRLLNTIQDQIMAPTTVLIIGANKGECSCAFPQARQQKFSSSRIGIGASSYFPLFDQA